MVFISHPKLLSFSFEIKWVVGLLDKNHFISEFPPLSCSKASRQKRHLRIHTRGKKTFHCKLIWICVNLLFQIKKKRLSKYTQERSRFLVRSGVWQSKLTEILNGKAHPRSRKKQSHIYIYIYIYSKMFSFECFYIYVMFIFIHRWGDCFVMLIVQGNGYGYTSSNPERGYLHFT